MTAEPTDSGEGLPNGSPPPVKRGRGRPKGSVNKTKFNLFPRKITRVPKMVQLFCASPPTERERKRGRPKKRLRGRPRKVPLSPEEEAERRLMEKLKPIKRSAWKPLGRPRIHPIGPPKPPGKRGRPRKYDYSPSRGTSESGANAAKAAAAPANRPPVVKRGRGRPPGSPNKRRGFRLSHQKKKSVGRFEAVLVDGMPRKRGRPPGSRNVLKRPLEEENDGPPRKRGRPPGSKKPLKEKPKVEDGGVARKRGRPRGAVGWKKRRRMAMHSGPKLPCDDITSSHERAEQDQLQPEEEEEEEVEVRQAATAANGNIESAPQEEGHDSSLAPLEDEAELEGRGEDGATVVKETAVGKSSSSGKKTTVSKRAV
ncbi:hypothetical protein ACEWY4_023772 [Coilia grayii]|uniref:Chromosomal protein D1-like n=1 Tax=Coilia grayii TaxID=363190 RepID=A0ABD1IYI6_9TELE